MLQVLFAWSLAARFHPLHHPGPPHPPLVHDFQNCARQILAGSRIATRGTLLSMAPYWAVQKREQARGTQGPWQQPMGPGWYQNRYASTGWQRR